MPFFVVEPEVAGGLGERTVLDRSVHPPVVRRLHYRLDGWLGDVLLESFPAFIVTKTAEATLVGGNVTGVAFDAVEIDTSEQFTELYPDRELPGFVWLRPIGQAGRDDVGTTTNGRLVVSRRVLDLLAGLRLAHAEIAPYEGDGAADSV